MTDSLALKTPTSSWTNAGKACVSGPRGCYRGAVCLCSFKQRWNSAAPQ